MLVAGWPTPLKNMSQIGSSSQLLGKIKKMFQTTQPDMEHIIHRTHRKQYAKLGVASAKTNQDPWSIAQSYHAGQLGYEWETAKLRLSPQLKALVTLQQFGDLGKISEFVALGGKTHPTFHPIFRKRPNNWWEKNMVFGVSGEDFPN